MSKCPDQARSPWVGEQVVLGLFHVFRLLFHAASNLPLDCAVDTASALPRSDRVVQPWSFSALEFRGGLRDGGSLHGAPARSLSLGCHCVHSTISRRANDDRPVAKPRDLDESVQRR